MRSAFSKILCTLGVAIVSLSPAPSAWSGEIQITVTNDQTAGGVALAPVWFGVQNGSFNVFSQGVRPARKLLPWPNSATRRRFLTCLPATVRKRHFSREEACAQFLPGQSNSTILNVSDPSVDRYLSFAGMVVPSNDFFMGNATPLQIFNSVGSFAGPVTIQVYGSDIWDSDTEQQSTTTGLTFIQGQTPGSGTQITDGSITPFLTEPGAASFLQSITGLTTVAGYQISHEFGANTPIATIYISSVPEPSSALLLGVGATAVLAVKRFSAEESDRVTYRHADAASARRRGALDFPR